MRLLPPSSAISRLRGAHRCSRQPRNWCSVGTPARHTCRRHLPAPQAALTLLAGAGDSAPFRLAGYQGYAHARAHTPLGMACGAACSRQPALPTKQRGVISLWSLVHLFSAMVSKMLWGWTALVEKCSARAARTAWLTPPSQGTCYSSLVFS